MRGFAFLLLAVATAAAQTVTGTIEGHVTDPAGAVIPDVVITVRGADTGLTRATRTNAGGYYQLGFLPLEPYEVSAEFQGFATVKRRVTVELNVTRQLDFSLKPSTIAQEVTVTDEAPLIETSRGEVRGTVEQKAIEDRPLSSRNILSLVEMLPGFQSSGGYSGVNNPTLSSGSYVSFNGTGSRSVSFQIDGVNNDDSSEGSNRQNVNISTIKEFQVLTNAYSAEFGRAGGAVVLVQTKSGTNRMHGDLYEFLQNEKLNANAFFNNAAGRDAAGLERIPRPPYRRNQFGGTWGGALKKNKLFLFSSFEQTKLAQYNTFNRFLMPVRTLQVGECRLCLRPEEHPNLEADRKFLQGILDAIPRVEPNNLAACDRCYTAVRPAYFPDEDYSGKIDYNPGQRDTIAVRYQYSRQKRRPQNFIDGENAWQNNKQQNFGLTHTHMFGPMTWGEFRFGLGLRTTLVDISTGNATPIIRIANPSPYGTTVSIGSAGAFPINRWQRDHQFVYNLSHVRGKQIFRMGVDFRRTHLDDIADNNSRGFWSFGATGVLGQPTRYEGWENFLRGYVSSFQQGYGNFYTENRTMEFNQYFMDDIKLKPNFTLNLGYRWEVVMAPSETQKRIDYVYGTFFRGHEPRVGFAWTPKSESAFWNRLTGGPGKFSVRGGFGIFHNRIFQSVFSQSGASLRSLPPYGVFRSYNPTFNVANPDLDFVYDPGNFNPGRIDYVRVPKNLGMPNVQQYNFTIERQLPGLISISLGYNRVRGIGLLQNQITNRARFPILSPVDGVLYDKVDENLANTAPAPGFISQAQPRTNQRRPDARYGNVIQVMNNAWSYSNSLRLEIKKRNRAGLHWSFAYSFGKSLDTGSDITAGNPITEGGSVRGNRGLSDFDQRQRANINLGYLLPIFKNTKGWRHAWFGGWTISSNITYASGNPFTVLAGYDVNADGVNNDRPILLDQSLYGRSVDNGRTGADGQQISVHQLPVAGFFPNLTVRQQGRFLDPGGDGRGSLGRNTFFGQGIRNYDAGLYKSFRIREGHNLTFRTEMYGVTNSPRFAYPVRDIQSPSFGRITSTYNPMNFVGASRNDTANRLMQFALRYTF